MLRLRLRHLDYLLLLGGHLRLAFALAAFGRRQSYFLRRSHRRSIHNLPCKEVIYLPLWWELCDLPVLLLGGGVARRGGRELSVPLVLRLLLRRLDAGPFLNAYFYRVTSHRYLRAMDWPPSLDLPMWRHLKPLTPLPRHNRHPRHRPLMVIRCITILGRPRTRRILLNIHIL